MIVASLLGSSFLHDVVECSSVKPIDASSSLSFDGSSSRGIVHKSQFSKVFSRFVSLKISFSSIDDFGAVILALTNNEEGISLLSLSDDCLSSLNFFLLHGLDNNHFLISVQGLEENGLVNEVLDESLSLSVFLDDLGNELGLLVELAENLSTDALTTHLFFDFLLLLLLKLLQNVGIVVFFLGLGMGLFLGLGF